MLSTNPTPASQDLVSKLERRVVAAAQAALDRQKFVCPLDVLTSIGWLPVGLVADWRRGRVDHLEASLAVPPQRVATALAAFHRWAQSTHLQPTEVAYLAATRGHQPLRFTAHGDPETERAYRTHWTLRELPEPERERLAARSSRPPDLVAIWPLDAFTCAGCGDTGADPLIMDDAGPLCLACADLDHLVFLPAGDAALTRRAKQASRLSAVVVRFSRTRKRYERQGLLVEHAALEQAEQQCLSDEAARAKRRERDRDRRLAADVQFEARLAAEIRRLFPGCPAERAAAIARHTATRGSGRVGRTAAGRALDTDAVTNAVVASVRHDDTGYDTLLMSGVPRPEARQQVQPDIDHVLDTWRGTGTQT
jgi:hypothetical protein